MKKPTFFIIGAPKCGTTSLAAWLSVHPNVFMSDPKEPEFFATDSKFRATQVLLEYEAIFEPAGNQHLAVGEASTAYLGSREAVPNILAYSPDSKFIVMLRKPQDMAISLHGEACRGFEVVRDFETAWRLQSERAQGRQLPKLFRNPEAFQYGEQCHVGSQLARLFTLVASERVLVTFLEQVRQQPSREYDKVLRFLGVPEFRPAQFQVENARRHVTSLHMRRVLQLLGRAKQMAGIRNATGLLAPLHRLNLSPGRQPGLSKPFKDELDAYFREEILIVENLVGQVPEEWLS